MSNYQARIAKTADGAFTLLGGVASTMRRQERDSRIQGPPLCNC